jgi:hypothetical protein
MGYISLLKLSTDRVTFFFGAFVNDHPFVKTIYQTTAEQLAIFVIRLQTLQT